MIEDLTASFLNKLLRPSHLHLNTTLVSRLAASKVGEHVGDVIPRVTVETSA
jgi:hypothetical protein